MSAPNLSAWTAKQVTKKVESYLEARPLIAGYEDAPIGMHFTQPGVEPAFRNAVEDAVAGLRAKHPGVDIRLRWTE